MTIIKQNIGIIYYGFFRISKTTVFNSFVY